MADPTPEATGRPCPQCGSHVVWIAAEHEVVRAREREEAALRIAHTAGITDAEVTAQINYDRYLTDLHNKRDDVATEAHQVLALVARLHDRLSWAEDADPGRTIQIAVLLPALKDLVDQRKNIRLPELDRQPPAPANLTPPTASDGGLFELELTPPPTPVTPRRRKVATVDAPTKFL